MPNDREKRVIRIFGGYSPTPSTDEAGFPREGQGAPPPGPIPPPELRRDARIFRALKDKGLSELERSKLFALARGHGRAYTAEDYRRYQVRLLELATAAGVRTGFRRFDFRGAADQGFDPGPRPER